MFERTLTGYGYAIKEDPLISAFKAIIFHGRNSDWQKVGDEIQSITDRINDIYTAFNIDLLPQIKQSILQRDFQGLTNKMANLVFHAIREKFHYNAQEKLKIFIRAKVRLRLAEEYYTTLLAGNVKCYDIRHKTAIHEKIYHSFVLARNTLGSRGFFGSGAIEPDVNEFEELTNEIESLLLQVFPYFEK